MGKYLAVCLLLFLTSACVGEPVATPTIPIIPVVGVSPFAQPFLANLAQPFVIEGRPLPFDIVPMVRPIDFDPSGQGAVAMYVDFSPGGELQFATPLGWEGIAVVANPQVPLRSLTLRDLADIYSGRAVDWSELGRGQAPIQPVIPPQGDSMRAAFLGAVMPEGRVTTLARLSPTPAEAVRLTAELAGAIALAPSTMDFEEAGVAVMRVEGSLPQREAILQGTYPLRLQVVAAAPNEPQGALRSWLIWVQQQDKTETP